MGCTFSLGLTSVGTSSVHGILYCSQDRNKTWPPKKFTKDKKNNKKFRKLLFLCDLFPLQCWLCIKKNIKVCFLKYAGHTASFHPRKEKETGADRAAKFSLDCSARGHWLSPPRSRKLTHYSRERKQRFQIQKKIPTFDMISFITQIVTEELLNAVLLPEKGCSVATAGAAWARTWGSARKVFKSSYLVIRKRQRHPSRH